MNTYRSAAVALTACAASLSLTACSAGTTTASTATTSPAARNSSSASASALASVSHAAPALASRTITVSGDYGSFPIPARAKVVENVAAASGAIVFFDKVAPAKVSSFYAQALPRAGYTITANSVISQSGGTVAFIQFTGHGVKGTIDALSKLAKFNDSTVSVAGLGHRNVTTISFMPK
jgi:ABC-type phosphate transport system substrate-binding protein